MLASVKNTFLHWYEAPVTLAPRLRSRSADSHLANETDDACAKKLNQLLKEPQRRRELLSPLPEQKPRAPSVEELRVLQRRIAEVSGLSALEGESLKKRILSSSSVSTMASEAEEMRPTKVGNMSKARSSGSVCSMCPSEMLLEEGQIAPIMEESGCPTVASAKVEFTHNQVPKNVNLAAEFSKKGLESPPTTMMIRNIPNRYTQREFIKEVDDLGFAATYDFLYLPIDKGTLCNVGYAFVNFLEPSDAQRCSEVFHNYVFQRYRKARGKICAVSIAHLQGLEANLQHYQNSAVNLAPRIKQRGPLIIPRGTIARLSALEGESLKKRILSSSSVSTMASEAEEMRPTKVGNMSKARSSGSVCSMCPSEMLLEEGQIAPIMEESGCPTVASAKDGTKVEFTHNQVPKNVNLAAEFSKKGLESPPTTMMIRNIPNRYTQREFIKEVDDLGFAATYDFLYLPIDKGTLCNVGYAFVNFLEPSDAQRCSEVFHNYVFQRYRKARGKICAVSIAHLQGLEANLQHYQNSAVNLAPRIKQRGPLIIPHGTIARATSHGSEANWLRHHLLIDLPSFAAAGNGNSQRVKRGTGEHHGNDGVMTLSGPSWPTVFQRPNLQLCLKRVATSMKKLTTV